MRQFGLRAGIAANPDTPFEAAEPHLDGVDVVLCNGEPRVRPAAVHGRGGLQVKALRAALFARGLAERADLEVDGAIDEQTALVAPPREPISSSPVPPSLVTTGRGGPPRRSVPRPPAESTPAFQRDTRARMAEATLKDRCQGTLAPLPVADGSDATGACSWMPSDPPVRQIVGDDNYHCQQRQPGTEPVAGCCRSH